MDRITGSTKLSTVKATPRPRSNVEVPARMVRSIQQSLRVEGYDVPERVVREAAERVVRVERARK